MKTKGIRILDKKDGVGCVELPDILKEISNGDTFYWSILYLYASGDLGDGKSIPVFEKEINDSARGLFIKWNELNLISKKFFQVIDIIIIGCKDQNLLRRYKNDQEMYETCDIFINMFDSWFWEIFSKDEQLINRFAAKFKKIELLESNFLNLEK